MITIETITRTIPAQTAPWLKDKAPAREEQVTVATIIGTIASIASTQGTILTGAPTTITLTDGTQFYTARPVGTWHGGMVIDGIEYGGESFSTLEEGMTITTTAVEQHAETGLWKAREITITEK